MKVNNLHLKQEWEKEIQARTKENIMEKHKNQNNNGKPIEATQLTHITDSSRNTEDSISQLGSFSPNLNFLQNTTIEEFLKESKPPNDY